MKKSTLALSIAAAIGSIGLSGAANAAMEVNPDGIGHQLVFPYFTAQSDNATLMSITNTDTVNGKLVKVRFRGAANSDDLYDFQVLLSPGDVWTAAVTQDATSGKAKLATSDKSCTLPASVNATFNTERLDPSATDAVKANGTREGYVEIITMGDIRPFETGGAGTTANALFTAAKHVNGVAPCTATTLQTALGTNTAVGLSAPTSSLAGDWIILNQKNTAAWSGSATALRVASGFTANIVFWPQKSGDVTLGSTETADPLLTKGIVTPQSFDLPDMSTVYTNNGAVNTAELQADNVTQILSVKSLANQFVTSDDIAAVTDFLFTQPTRRYHVAVNYTATATDNLAKTGALVKAVFRNTGTTPVTQDGGTGPATAAAPYRAANMAFPTGSRTLCLNNITAPGRNARFDREELTPAAAGSTDFVISPRIPTAPTQVFVCGEAAVLSINNSGTVTDSALAASVARNDVTFAAGYENGWMRFDNINGGAGLPILGASFLRMANGAVNYGASYAHKVTR